MAELRFHVYGEPKPGGSKRVFLNRKTGKPIVTDDSGKAGKAWRADVRDAAFEAIRRTSSPLLERALAVEFHFRVRRPKGHFGTGRNAALVKTSAPPYPAIRPDVLKLARAVEDALTGIVWVDDALIVKETLTKSYSERPGVTVIVTTLSSTGARS